MNTSKIWMILLMFLSAVSTLTANIDLREHFCGSKLVKTLTELCDFYNAPVLAGHDRFRRQIIQECCESPCSKRYLMQYYCLQVNRSISDKILSKMNSGITGTSNSKSLNINNKKNSYTSQSHSKMLIKTGNKIARGKRNCKCRKRRAQRVKKLSQLQTKRNTISLNKVAPPPNIGHIEESEKPFYVWRFGRVFKK